MRRLPRLRTGGERIGAERSEIEGVFADPLARAPIIWNPFVGLDAADAHDRCYKVMDEFVSQLPKRPASPADRDEYGCTYFLTNRGNDIYEAVRASAIRALKEAGHTENEFAGPIQEV